ncbi:MAG: hypothetical protein GPJ09_23520 [Microcystis aeruginosa SX13-01]|nr:hypothetical protein [Microcystis aeruginosa SX13-01]
MTHRKIGAALKRICNYENINLSRDEVKIHIDRLVSENIPSGLSDESLDEIILDYLKDEKVLV